MSVRAPRRRSSPCLRCLIGVGVVTFRSVPAEFTPQADNGRVFIGIEGARRLELRLHRRLRAPARGRSSTKEMEKGEIERVLIRVPGQGGSDLRTGDVNTARGFLILKTGTTASTRRARSRSRCSREARKLPGVTRAIRPARRPRPRRLAVAGRRRARRPGLRAARGVVGSSSCSSRSGTPASRTSEQLQGAQAADSRVDRPRPRGRPRRLARDRRPHARDRARLAHRDDVHRPRPRVQRDPPGPRRHARDDHGPHEHPRALDAHERADPAVERREARGDVGHDAAVALQPAALGQDLGRPRERLHDG